MAIDLTRLPQSADTLTPGWLTDALRSSGTIGAATRVAQCDAKPLGAGGGLIGVVARVALTYDGDATSALVEAVTELFTVTVASGVPPASKRNVGVELPAVAPAHPAA